MWSNQYYRMLNKSILIFTIFLAACEHSSLADSPHAEALYLSLSKAEKINFYFVSRTGEYDFDSVKFRNEATITVFRSCGANCTNLMSEVINHLRESTLAECQSGQQNVLITWDKQQIIYSYSGRFIRFNGVCFYNEKSINDIVEQSQFFFR